MRIALLALFLAACGDETVDTAQSPEPDAGLVARYVQPGTEQSLTPIPDAGAPADH